MWVVQLMWQNLRIDRIQIGARVFRQATIERLFCWSSSRYFNYNALYIHRNIFWMRKIYRNLQNVRWIKFHLSKLRLIVKLDLFLVTPKKFLDKRVANKFYLHNHFTKPRTFRNFLIVYSAQYKLNEIFLCIYKRSFADISSSRGQ